MSTATTVHRIEVRNSGDAFACADGLDVLRAMECLGRRHIPVGCRGGGCGVCKVRVLSGDYRTEKMSRACVSLEEQGQGYALACRLFARGDLHLEAVGRFERLLQRGAAPAFIRY
jgi:ferredoxin